MTAASFIFILSLNSAPVRTGLFMTGLVSVLFVKVSVFVTNDTVPVAFGKVIVLSASGFSTVKMVSWLSNDEPSNCK